MPAVTMRAAGSKGLQNAAHIARFCEYVKTANNQYEQHEQCSCTLTVRALSAELLTQQLHIRRLSEL
jgi:hypothetical protein